MFLEKLCILFSVTLRQKITIIIVHPPMEALNLEYDCVISLIQVSVINLLYHQLYPLKSNEQL